MIEGIGVDVVEIPRFKRVIESWDDTFLSRIFTEKELAYSASKVHQAQHLAARFAVKEAVSKAMGKGWNNGFKWKDIEVENDASGKPEVILHGNASQLLNGKKVLVSISHSENVVIAFAVIETT